MHAKNCWFQRVSRSLNNHFRTPLSVAFSDQIGTVKVLSHRLHHFHQCQGLQIQFAWHPRYEHVLPSNLTRIKSPPQHPEFRSYQYHTFQMLP